MSNVEYQRIEPVIIMEELDDGYLIKNKSDTSAMDAWFISTKDFKCNYKII